jgi:hypothetical protein
MDAVLGKLNNAINDFNKGSPQFAFDLDAINAFSNQTSAKGQPLSVAMVAHFEEKYSFNMVKRAREELLSCDFGKNFLSRHQRWVFTFDSKPVPNFQSFAQELGTDLVVTITYDYTKELNLSYQTDLLWSSDINAGQGAFDNAYFPVKWNR